MTLRRFKVLAKKYGVWAVLTGQWRRVKHAARGRAKRTWENGLHSTAGGAGDHTAAQLIEALRRERRGTT
jgi:hypothetical protein